jgi:hypothetical protein
MDYTPSRFIRKTLMPNEKCVKDARFSWVYIFQAWVVWGICLILGYMVHYGFMRYLGLYDLRPVYIGAGIGGWLFFWMMMKKWTTEIILTTERLIYKQGYFMVDVAEVDIEQLASDRVEQSFFGRIFDYGNIYIRCIEAPDIWLPPIRRPYEFRNALEQQKHLYREHYMKVEHLRHHGDKPEDNA